MGSLDTEKKIDIPNGFKNMPGSIAQIGHHACWPVLLSEKRVYLLASSTSCINPINVKLEGHSYDGLIELIDRHLGVAVISIERKEQVIWKVWKFNSFVASGDQCYGIDVHNNLLIKDFVSRKDTLDEIGMTFPQLLLIGSPIWNISQEAVGIVYYAKSDEKFSVCIDTSILLPWLSDFRQTRQIKSKELTSIPYQEIGNIMAEKEINMPNELLHHLIEDPFYLKHTLLNENQSILQIIGSLTIHTLSFPDSELTRQITTQFLPNLTAIYAKEHDDQVKKYRDDASYEPTQEDIADIMKS